MKRRLIFISLSLLMLSIGMVKADEAIRFSASAPSSVILDHPFQLVYELNATGRELRVPEIADFDVLAGPFESRSSSIQYINGKSTSSVSVSYTYTLQAKKVGTFTISSAAITVSGQKYTSNGVAIKVLPADAATKTQSGQSGSGDTQSISSDNVFIRTNVSKSNVYEQEAVLVTYKLYTLVDVVQCANRKMPDFSGFMKQDIEQAQNKQFSYEHYNGKNYGTVVLYQVLLYPQRTGLLEITPATFEAAIRIQNKRSVRSIFDDFFDSYTNVSKNLLAPAAKITVKPLPANRPASFNGTLGHFNMTSTISNTEVKANEAVTIKVNISGTGNMKLIKNPEIKFPEGFELYDPKVANNFKTSTSGTSGTKVIEFLFIPRHAGNYEIPAAEFTYFDIQEKSYKTLRTSSYQLKVLKGDASDVNSTITNNYVDKEDVKQIGNDIRYIQTKDFALNKVEDPLVGSFLSWMLYIVPLFISLILFVFFRKQAKDNSNLQLVKNKKANRIAKKRLKSAQKLLSEGNKDQFYEEVLKAAWTYLGDKLSISVSELTKERVETELSVMKVPADIVNKFVYILNTCEFARYAPNTGQEEMGNLYDETLDVISNLEEIIKKS